MTFQHIRQDHPSGCFVACVAMLMGTSYHVALRRVHPYVNVHRTIYPWLNLSLSPEESINKLVRLGIHLTPSKVRKISSLRKDALLLIRWAIEPNLMHAVIYDHAKKRILDPAGRIYDLSKWRGWKIAWVEKQLDAVYYIRN